MKGRLKVADGRAAFSRVRGVDPGQVGHLRFAAVREHRPRRRRGRCSGRSDAFGHLGVEAGHDSLLTLANSNR